MGFKMTLLECQDLAGFVEPRVHQNLGHKKVMDFHQPQKRSPPNKHWVFFSIKGSNGLYGEMDSGTN